MKRILKSIAAILIIGLLISGCAIPGEKQELSVAVYPHMPGLELFKEVLLQEWEKLEPDVELILEDWDCYSGVSECDVLMYDTVVLTHLAENGYIQPIRLDEIQGKEDMLPFVMDGLTYNGEYYGAPYFLCGDILAYYKDDAEMAKIENIVQLHSLVQERRKLDPEVGVMVYTEIGNPYHYLDASIDLANEYTMFEQMPDCDNLDEQVLQSLDLLDGIKLELPEALREDKSNGELFAEGHGFAYYGVSEHLSYMDDILDQLIIRNISFSEEKNIPLFYADVTSVASHITDPDELALCKKLMNMVASDTFQKELLLKEGMTKYLLPARQSVYLSAAEEYPMYEQLYKIVMDERNEIFRCGSDFYTYVENFYEE